MHLQMEDDGKDYCVKPEWTMVSGTQTCGIQGRISFPQLLKLSGKVLWLGVKALFERSALVMTPCIKYSA